MSHPSGERKPHPISVEEAPFLEGVESVLTQFAVDSAEALHWRFRYRLFGAVEGNRFEPARSSPPFFDCLAAILR
jgi:hypothetical protein